MIDTVEAHRTTSVAAVRGRHVLVDEVFVPATVVLRRGRIAAVEDISVSVDGLILDAPDSAYVLPGNVDTHVHANEPGRTEWEGFASATEAAARGGATTLIDMPLNAIPPTTTVAALHAKQRAAERRLMVDVGFWGGVVPGNLADLRPLWDEGVFGFKCFLSPSGVDEFPPVSDEEFRQALTRIESFGGLMLVHAEDTAALQHAPAPPSKAYRDFLLSRPDRSETIAIDRVIRGARETGARVHIVHLSSARALEGIAAARDEGLPVTVETCPHYLCFAAESIPDAAPQFKCCPPIRDSGNREELWQALSDGIIDCVVSDHSPAPAREKLRGDGDLQMAWGGVSGLQVGLAAVAHEARRREVPLGEVSRWMARGPADLVGLTHKGRVEPGADADLTIYDTAVTFDVEAAALAHRHPMSAYEGQRYEGRVVETVLGGEVVGAGREASGRRLVRPDAALQARRR